MDEACLVRCDACADECTEKPFPAWNLVMMVVLVLLSGCFSGLTLGLLSLSLEGLDIIIHGGRAQERRWASLIYPVRKRGNLLLCTLLLGNTLVNALIAILSADLTSGLVGGLLSTGIIVIFGEIIPQAICSRHGLRIGALSICIVRPLMCLLSPVTFPIAKALDAVLGREMGMAYNKKQLDKLLELHSADHAISSDDQQLLSSALNFSEKNTGMIMTKLDDVFMISITDKLDFDNLKAIYQSGYTRVPVYQNKRTIIVGVLFAKDLILVDPNDEIPVASILPFCSRAVNAAPLSTHLDEMLKEMQSSRSHLFFIVAPGAGSPRVSSSSPFMKKLPFVDHVVGVVTMEDLIEELISKEIIDDFDEVSDNVSRKTVAQSRRADRIEFFDMLQRREIMQLDQTNSSTGGTAFSAKTNEEVRALVSFLSSNVAMFKPAAMSTMVLRKLVLRSNLIYVSSEDVKQGKFLYVRGIHSPYACLLLHGRLQIRAGNDGFTSDVGPWTPLSLQALVDDKYAPDYTAQCITPSRVFFVSRHDLLAVLAKEHAPHHAPADARPMERRMSVPRAAASPPPLPAAPPAAERPAGRVVDFACDWSNDERAGMLPLASSGAKGERHSR